MNPIQIPWKTHYYYRNRLTGIERYIYDCIFDGLQNWKQKIPMPPGSKIDKVYEIYSMVIAPCFFMPVWAYGWWRESRLRSCPSTG